MSILYRYVTREILGCFWIILAAVLSIYVVVDFIEKVDNFLEVGLPVARCLSYLLYKLPFIVVQIAPAVFLLAVLVALGLMSKNHEVIALKSCGIGKERLLKPVLVLGLLVGGGLFVIAETVVPVFMARANQIWIQEVRQKNIYASRTNDVWMRTARQIIHIKQYLPEKQALAGVTVHTFDERFRLTGRVDAVSGRYENQQWRLDDAVEQVFEAESGLHQVTLHESIAVAIDLNPDDLAQAAKHSDEMGLAELGRYIDKVEREGYGAVRFRVDYHAKMAAPFVYIFLSLLGVAVALRGKLREGLPVSITYGLGIAFLYWIFNSFCLALGYAEILPPVVAAWTANLVFSCVSGMLLFNTN